MPLEYRAENGELIWVRNPFTGVVTYFTHVHRKRSGFRSAAPLIGPAQPDRRQLEEEFEAARRSCPFCPGNEALSAGEILRVSEKEALSAGAADRWLIRAVRNLIPRIPESCTGGHNESYVVIEDPRHFVDDANGQEDLLCSAMLPPEQFQALLRVDLEVARRAYANPAVGSVLIRKNQGRESGASQPHVHNQVIGSDIPFPVIARECEVTAQQPRIWSEIISFVRDHGLMLDERGGCVSYFCPFGTFPRSYEVVCPEARTRAMDVPEDQWRSFVGLLYDIVCILGATPLDYEIHEGPGVPLHAHVNARHFAYSNIGGTLNLPSNLVANRQSIRQRP
jgi:galactose-1-phosphate uridylyltransferase